MQEKDEAAMRRQVLVRLLGKFPMTEIADVLGVSPKTLYADLSHLDWRPVWINMQTGEVRQKKYLS